MKIALEVKSNRHRFRMRQPENGQWCIDIGNKTLFVFYPLFSYKHDSLRVAIFFQTCMIMQMAADSLRSEGMAIRIFGFGFGYCCNDIENPFKMPYKYYSRRRYYERK